jgi:hypothetical protein
MGDDDDEGNDLLDEGDNNDDDDGEDDFSDADAGTLMAMRQSLQTQFTPTESRAVRHGQRGRPGGDEDMSGGAVEDEDLQLSESQLRDKEYARLLAEHNNSSRKRPTSKEQYSFFEAAKAWAGERKANAARAKKHKR